MRSQVVRGEVHSPGTRVIPSTFTEHGALSTLQDAEIRHEHRSSSKREGDTLSWLTKSEWLPRSYQTARREEERFLAMPEAVTIATSMAQTLASEIEYLHLNPVRQRIRQREAIRLPVRQRPPATNRCCQDRCALLRARLEPVANPARRRVLLPNLALRRESSRCRRPTSRPECRVPPNHPR